MREIFPNFVIIGAAKSATTSLDAYMQQHPQIYMSPLKEPCYFAYEGEATKTFLGKTPNNKFPIKTLDDYLKLFEGVNNEDVIGETSPIYLESIVAPLRIAKTLPDVKLLVSLRNPCDRAFSDYMMAMNDGDENLDPDNALVGSSHYLQAGFYYEKLKRYYELFERSKIHVCLYDEFIANESKVLGNIYDFLDVDTTFKPHKRQKLNVGGYPKSTAIAKVISRLRHSEKIVSVTPLALIEVARWIKKKNTGNKKSFPPELRSRLLNTYKNDILALQDLIQRDLGKWIAV